ncbi:uncharacterized protein LOC114282454 [Camellia sinensis]|uniref:uncharacterized protein LOC114282454 n=1 Tax=Camellia sinensis TaxID=4442 RepID=UPI0010369CF3|nr:uncharacterized protein LOC114282454 [Camellia sinensis]
MASENSSFVQPVIPHFDGHYDHWSILVENFLRSKEYWGLIANAIVEPVDDAVLTNTQTKAIDYAILQTILKKDTAKKIWDSLKNKYQGTTRVKHAQLQALRQEFETLHMKGDESVNDYFARTLAIANKMCIHGEKMGDVAVIEQMLRSMTPKFDYVICSTEESNDIDSISIDELQSSLLVHEQRMTKHVMLEQALQVSIHGETSTGRSKGRGKFQGR